MLFRYLIYIIITDLLQGAQASQLEKQIGSENFPQNEHYFGLVNVCTMLKYN